MIAATLLICLLGFVLGGLGLYCASRDAAPSVRQERKKKFIAYFLIVHLVLLSALMGRFAVVMLFTIIISIGAGDLRRVVYPVRPSSSLRPSGIFAVYFLSAALLLILIFRAQPQEVIFVYLVVAAFDGFSQVFGQLFGVRPIASKISPGKTVEGAIGGCCAALAVAVSIRHLVNLGPISTIFACLTIAGAGLAGDLLASWVKRVNAVKDFGCILPGHGGVLDRFDSFLLAAPVSLFLLQLMRS